MYFMSLLFLPDYGTLNTCKRHITVFQLIIKYNYFLRYVPKFPDGIQKILVGGDRLTEGNCRNVQLAFSEGETEDERLEGLVFKFEDWHAIRNLFEVCEHFVQYKLTHAVYSCL